MTTDVSEAQDDVIAAVDLGSNSFHMVVATLRHGQLTVIDRLRETVRLAEGLSKDLGLAAPARQRALDCLEQFGERLREMRADRVRAAGTNTLRRVRKDAGFLSEAERALGHPIEIIAGVEEARLIYLGVAQSLPPEAGRRLVIDIGGGSTELIVGEGLEAAALESLGMGCVVKTERFFPGGQISVERFAEARMSASLKLRPVKTIFRESGWLTAIGASGTIRSTIAVAREVGLIASDEPLRLPHVEALIEKVIAAGHIKQLSLPGLSDRRAEVWPGGLAILAEVMRTLSIDGLIESDGALREGVLYDLVGRLQHSDARVRSVIALAERYHVDQAQSRRVRETALQLFDALKPELEMDPELARLLLKWSGHLHEIGLDIAHADFHQHGAYVVRHADLPGFPAAEQQLLAFMIANQRKRPSTARAGTASRPVQEDVRLLTVLLRLAVLINRNRSDASPAAMTIRLEAREVTLGFDADWLDANPLTRADIDRERALIKSWGYTLGVETMAPRSERRAVARQ